ncbi:MAG: hypothetical protein QNL62_17870 [Gammaproteobacteria bacterium]|nr:hypothetical protein [Gammaproteobacteria bacterium]
MNNKVSDFVLSGFSFVLGCTTVYAEEESIGLHGCYTADSGYVESASISESQQIGTYRIILKHNNWTLLSDEDKSYTLKRFVAAGPILGNITSFDNTGQVILNHIISDKERRGFLMSHNDVFTPTTFPEPCNNESGYILTGIETVSIAAGTGIFADLNLQPGASIEVEGTVNSCSGENDFEVISGQLCFKK